MDNRYDVVQPLGSGGMGEVYLARDRTLGRDVALKVLRSQYAGDRESAERFKREATSAARLSHPNIVQVYDRGDTEDGSSYIAMEYVPGGTLKERITRDGPLDARTAASFAYQVAEALGAAHEKGVVHRDIKPQNVLITAPGTAKVADFGIARAASAATGSQTKTGTVMGTAAYMSPEQALGNPATPRSDLYSLGVVLYEALTGRLPFTADNPVAVSMKHVNEAPRPPREIDPGVPHGMNAIVMKLLSKSPEDRYADAEELAGDLWRARRGMPPAVAAEPATVETPTRRPPQTGRQAAAPPRGKGRGRTPLLLGLLFLLLGLLGLGWAFSQPFQDFSPRGVFGGAGVEVPDVGGLPRDEAVARLEGAGLSATVRAGESSGEDAGTVVSQAPSSGERVDRGSTVTLTVGSSTVTVPEVVGLSVADAEADLEGAGLAAGSLYDVQSGTAAEGVVVEQGLAPGDEVDPGTAVNLGVSSGAAAPASASSSASPAPSEPTIGSPAPDDASASPAASPQADPEEAEPENPGNGERAQPERAQPERAQPERAQPGANQPQANPPGVQPPRVQPPEPFEQEEED